MSQVGYKEIRPGDVPEDFELPTESFYIGQEYVEDKNKIDVRIEIVFYSPRNY